MLRACLGCGLTFSAPWSRSTCCSVGCRLKAGAERKEATGCLEWTGATGSHGYGVLNVGGAIVSVHRLAYELAFGAIEPDSFVCHRCDNKRCIEPTHLFAGTPGDNARDMTAKGRHWIKGKSLSPEYRIRLRVPKSSTGISPEERSAINRRAWRTRKQMLKG